jgi:uncharacterized membrane protein
METASWDKRLERTVLRGAALATRHWLALVNAALVVFVTLPLLAPLLMAQGYTGPARAIYTVYRMTCHQEPARSYFLGGPRFTYGTAELEAMTPLRPLAVYTGSAQVGYKVAYCERDLASYTMMLVTGLTFALVRRRLPRLPLRLYVVLLLPIAVDGLTQLAGLRESTWLLRTITGGLFGMATAWLLLPELDKALLQASLDFERSAGDDKKDVRRV